MVEFSADIANFANPCIVSFFTRVKAQQVGNVHIAQNFLNVVPYTVGDPVPLPRYSSARIPD